jgi:phosphopantothenoylcysteine decarboxylase / phosphopantothenate---cysteine ligase
MFTGKRILLGISGSIAAYKAADLIGRLREREAEVRVVMTRAATRFLAPLTCEVLSGKPVLTDEFTEGGWGTLGHISVTDGLHCALIAPATANIIGKIAAGIADDALSTAVLAAECPLLVAPAMNERMYRSAALQRNIGSLRGSGVRFVGPEEGPLACGVAGPGRLASSDAILHAIGEVLARAQTLRGVRVLITAGPTREPIDAVRFISNPSTGKMGFALAAEASERGADVTLVAGPTMLAPPRGVQTLSVTTAAEMHAAVRDRSQQADVIIMAAAVSDFRPAAPVVRKVKKEDAERSVALERTEDILLALGNEKGTRILVGFAAETDHLAENAKRKLEQKKLDLIIANRVGTPDAGFGADTNRALIIDRRGKITEAPLMSKRELAGRILDEVEECKRNQGL